MIQTQNARAWMNLPLWINATKPFRHKHGQRTPNKAFFHWKQDLWAWADKFWDINQPLFLQKTKPLYPYPKYILGIGISFVDSPWIREPCRINLGLCHQVRYVEYWCIIQFVELLQGWRKSKNLEGAKVIWWA